MSEVITEQESLKKDFNRIGNTEKKKWIVVSYSMVIGEKKICKLWTPATFISSS